MSNVNLKTDFKDGDKLYAEQLNNNFELIKEAFAKGATGDVVWQDGTTVKFRRYITTDIEKLPILDGAIIYDIQKGRNYIDYDGKRIQVGSAGNEVIIGDETQVTEDTKIFINTDNINNLGSEVVNSLDGNETNKAPSVNIVNNALSNIIESGSNEKGSWTKYSDGTMICYGTWSIGAFTTGSNSIGSLYYGDINIWHSFPKEFISKPIVSFDIYDTRSSFTGSIWLQKKSTTVETVRFGNVRVLSATNTTLNIAIDFIAIGRWK